jgi:hypothetical protein
MAMRDEGEYPWWIFDRKATQPGAMWRENPSFFATATAVEPGGTLSNSRPI